MDNFRDFVFDNDLTTFEALSRLDVVTLGNQVNTIDRDLTNLRSQVNQIAQTTESSALKISTLEVKQDTLKTRVDNLVDDFSDLTDRIIDLENDVSTFNNRITTVEQGFSDLEEKVNMSIEKVDDLSDELSQISSQVDQNTLDIQNRALKSDVDSLNTKLTNLQSSFNNFVIATEKFETDTFLNSTRYQLKKGYDYILVRRNGTQTLNINPIGVRDIFFNTIYDSNIGRISFYPPYDLAVAGTGLIATVVPIGYLQFNIVGSSIEPCFISRKNI